MSQQVFILILNGISILLLFTSLAAILRLVLAIFYPQSVEELIHPEISQAKLYKWIGCFVFSALWLLR